MKGELIGINGRGSFDKRSRINSGVGYAISINQIKNFLGHLKAGLDTDHASLGALVRTEAENNGIGKTKVTSILEESDAFRRGLDTRTTRSSRSRAGRSPATIITRTYSASFRAAGACRWNIRRGDKDKKEILVRLMGVQKKEVGDGGPAEPIRSSRRPKERQRPRQGPAAKFYEPKAGLRQLLLQSARKESAPDRVQEERRFPSAKGTWTIEGTVRLVKANANSDFTLTDEGRARLT